MNAIIKPAPFDNSLSIAEPNTLVRSFDLVSFRYLPKLGEMICVVRDRATGATKQALGSNLRIYWRGAEKYVKDVTLNFAEDAYLLELARTGGTSHV